MTTIEEYLGGYFSQEGTDYCGAVSIFNLISFLPIRNKVLNNLYKQSKSKKYSKQKREAMLTLYNILKHVNADQKLETVPAQVLMRNNLLKTLENINYKFVYGVDDGKYRQSFTPGKILRFLFQATSDDDRYEFYTINSPNGVAVHTSRSIIPGLSNYYVTVLIHRYGPNKTKYENSLNNYLYELVETESSIRGMMIGTDYHCLCLVIDNYDPPLLVNSFKTKSAYQTDQWSKKLGKLSATVILHTKYINFLEPDLVYQFPREIKAFNKLLKYNIYNLLELYETPRKRVREIEREINYPYLLTFKYTIKRLILKNKTKKVVSDW